MDTIIKYYVTSECQRKIDKGRYNPLILKKLEELKQESKQDYVADRRNGKQYIYKYKIKGGPRFIFFKEQRRNAKVYVLREIYKSHDEYTNIINSNDFRSGRWYNQYSYSANEKQEIEIVFEDIFSECPEAQKEYPELSSAESAFVNDKCNINQEIFDETIYETAEWVNMMQNSDFDDFDSVAEPLLEFILNNCNNDNYGVSEIDVKFKDGKQKIVLNRFKNNEQSSKWVLHQIINKGENYTCCQNGDEVLKNCRRAYPYTVLENKDFWRNMEQDPNSNFILSEEEVGIISGENNYPLFISGRAGSGKSTVLQYLFAEKILQYSQFKGIGQLNPPVYLSYSKELVKTARDLSKSLFGKNHIYREELKTRDIKYEEELESQIEGFFFEFKGLIKNSIKEKNPKVFERNAKFDEGKYVTFTRFRQLWTIHFGKLPEAVKKYDPTISWHIIRTYIKGWNSKDIITPEDYSEIGKDNQDVNEETFKLVYQKVWDEWYSKSGYWDDQDLVKYCLNPDDGNEPFVTDRFSAVFCDESQDFTRAEIDFILKLSSFSSRKYNNVNEIHKLPFVFAGDEFQTLNPTGFSWDSLKGYFTECLSDITGFDKKDISPDDPISLTKNYRSTAQIVKLGNRMQLLRESRFLQRSEPQNPYFSDEGRPVFCFSPFDKKVWDELKKNDVVLIVPSSDGQTPKDYIEGTDIKDMITFYKDGVAENLTILNPVQAKGLEYSNVAIYGFDCKNYPELSIAGLSEWFDNGATKRTDKDIDLKYQVNNAYVAVTRAKKNLFVIDQFDQNSFWAFAFSSTSMEAEIELLEQKMLNNLSEARKKVWQNTKLGWIVQGRINDITDENKQDDSNIKKLADQGKEIGNAGMLRQAAARYKEREKEKEASECNAWAYEFELNYEKAAEFFVKAGNYDDAVRVLWTYLDSEKSDKDKVIFSISQIEQDSLKVDICKLLQEKIIPISDISATLLKIRDNQEQCCYNAWKYIIEKLLNYVYNTTNLSDNDFKIITKLYSDLSSLYDNIGVDVIIKTAYKTNRYKMVIELCDKYDKTDMDEYNESKLKTLPYPEILSYYKRSDDILSAYEEHKDAKLSATQKSIIGNAALEVRNLSIFRIFFPSMMVEADNAEKCYNLLKSAKDLGEDLNTDVFNALIALKFDKLEGWTNHKVYNAFHVNSLFEIVEQAQKYRTNEGFREFKEELAKELKSASNVVSVFDKTYGIYLDNPYLPLLLFVLGLQMEKRGLHKDSVPYYRWAIEKIAKIAGDKKTKQGLEKRWIVCKEAFHKVKPEVDLQDTKEKRKELGMTEDEPIAEKTNINDVCDWEYLFARAFNESTELFKPETPQPSENVQPQQIISKEPKVQIVQSENIVPKKIGIQEIVFPDFGGYKIKYSPSKKELTIHFENQENEEDLNVKIKNCNFTSEDDFKRGDTGRLLKTDSEEKTPFEVSFDENNNIVLKVYKDDVYTGISLKFE